MKQQLQLSEALERIKPADVDAMRRAESRQLSLTKPVGALGRLEEVSIRLAGIYGDEKPSVRDKAVIIAVADHGVTAQGVSSYPQAVTSQMVSNFLRGGAAVSVMANLLGIRQVVVDAGIAADALPRHPDLRYLRIGRGTRDISQGPAMSSNQAIRCVEGGINLAVEIANAGADLIGIGDMGIGNTTASSAITASITGEPPELTTGEGAGRTPVELRQKIHVVRKALEVNEPDPNNALEVLAKVGGFEIGVLAGVALGSASMRRAVLLDGFISGAAALVAHGLCASVSDYMIASHRSVERAMRLCCHTFNSIRCCNWACGWERVRGRCSPCQSSRRRPHACQRCPHSTRPASPPVSTSARHIRPQNDRAAFCDRVSDDPSGSPTPS